MLQGPLKSGGISIRQTAPQVCGILYADRAYEIPVHLVTPAMTRCSVNIERDIYIARRMSIRVTSGSDRPEHRVAVFASVRFQECETRRAKKLRIEVNNIDYNAVHAGATEFLNSKQIINISPNPGHVREAMTKPSMHQ